MKEYNVASMQLSSTEINECTSRDQLIAWKLDISLKIGVLRTKITDLNKAASRKVKYKLVLVAILNQVESKIREFSSEHKAQNKLFHSLRMEREQQFWKDKIKEIAPEMFEDLCYELSGIIGEDKKSRI